ncbi:hypothetical protein DCE93_12020 [Agromyces badenianii]|uniref:Uncharacterized protein n=1 Tax=Agromyces badenianii TaxID=2080742 RepID=A0A2S0WY79_9MICO|nr:hypothetical protein [Agromyces badenianii]AWB96286.1 hypothetical protein DCE93_12020 [Agromyces badenianii]PWC05151.1 hypothetical protein DCE94_02260 [Agromyces badenianii]
MDAQNEPIEDGHDDATLHEKVVGLTAQVKSDLELGAVDDLHTMVRQRLEDAGLPAAESDVDAIVSEVRAR